MAIKWECPKCHHRMAEKRKKCTYCGTIKTKDVVWWVDLTYRSSGKRIRKRVGRNKQAAILLEAKLKEKKSEIEIAQKLGKETEEFKTDEVLTLKEFWVRYKLWCKPRNRAWRDKEMRWKQHIKPFFGHKLLTEITPKDVKEYQLNRLKDGVTGATINREIALLQHMLNTAVKWGYIQTNPISGKIEKFQENKDKWTYLTPDEVERIRENLKEIYKDLFDFLLYTGLRLGDALRLRWEDINLYSGFILVRGNRTKGGKTFGIPLNQKAREVLEKKLTKEKNIRKEDKVFKHSDGHFRRAFKKALEKAGLPKTIRVHDLRHTFASWLAMSGVPIQQIQVLMGHSQINMTLRYAHLNPAVLQPAAEAAVQFSQNFLQTCEFQSFKSTGRNQNFSFELNTFKFPGRNKPADSTLRHRH